MSSGTTHALQPAIVIDPMVVDAATRAFEDLATQWHAGEQTASARSRLLQSVVDLGFADALPSPDAREAWQDAAAILRAQARASAPLDMALIFAGAERTTAIAYDPERYDRAARAELTDGPAANALALGRCLQISGALDAALELSLRYVRDRRQFGQPLAKFQAIQHSLAIAAEHGAAFAAIADVALACAVREGISAARMGLLLDAAAVVANRSVDVVYDMCHQAHGAIGFTREYALHRHSLDLQRWRDSLELLRGAELRAAERLGDAAIARGGVWRAVTAVMTPGDNA